MALAVEALVVDPVALLCDSASSKTLCPQPVLLSWPEAPALETEPSHPASCISTGKMWVAEGPAPDQWSLRDGAHAGHFLAMAEHLRTTGQLVDVAVGPEGDVAHAVVLASISSFFHRFLEGRTRQLRQDPPPHVPLPPGTTVWGWRALLTFAYGGVVPHGRVKEVEEAARALGAPRLAAACTLRLEIDHQEEDPKPLEEQWETLRAMEQLRVNGVGCDLQLQAGNEVIPGGQEVGVPYEGLRSGTGCPGTAKSSDGDDKTAVPGGDQVLEVPTELLPLAEMGL